MRTVRPLGRTGVNMIKRLVCLSLVLLTSCGMPIYTADLGKVHVEILSQPQVQVKCAERGVGLHPVIGYPLGSFVFACAGQYEGQLFVYSIDSAGSLLHELDHVFNDKRCHTLLGFPAKCSD